MSDENAGINIKADVEIKADLGPVITATPTGLRYIFNLLLGKKHAEAERMLKLADAQNLVDVKRIMDGNASYDLSSDRLIEAKSETSNPKQMVAEKIQDEEISNLINCAIQAAPYIHEKKGTETSTESEEFINRWRNEAKLISTKTAQAIWGRVLAEEVNAPGSISLRTVDVIKNLSKEEAAAFNDACKFIVFDRYLVDNKGGSPISNDMFRSINDAGLIATFTPSMYTGSQWPETKFSISKELQSDVYYVRAGRFFIFVEKEQLDSAGLQRPSFSYWELTLAGRELYKVIRDTLDIQVADIVKCLSEAGEDIIKKLKYTMYTDIGKSEVNTDSIRTI